MSTAGSESLDGPGAGILVPWLEPLFDQLLVGREQLHHALLIHGPAGIGKLGFARQLAAALLCEQVPRQADARACGQCQACHWVNERSHPDFRALVPEALDPDFVPAKSRKPSREIKIDQIRALARFLNVGSHRNGWRIVLIYPADSMNYTTANALLKTLEEPGERTVLILVSSQPNRLAPTVRSRCRQMRLSGPDHQTALDWLLANGAPDKQTAEQALASASAPLHALQLVDPARATAHQAILEAVSALPDTGELRAVDELNRHEPIQWADVLQRWLSDLARVGAGSSPHYFPGSATRLKTLSGRTNLDRTTRLQARLLDLNARIEYPLDARLICESSVLAYCQLFDRAGELNE